MAKSKVTTTNPAHGRKPSGKPARASKPPPIAVSAARPMVACTDCGKCCTYVAIEIDTPSSLKNATLALWYLYHENISLYCSDDEWLVQFETRCRNQMPDKRCGVYTVRPHICRDFSEKECEVNTGDDGKTFRTPAQFLAHMHQYRPKVYEKLAQGYARPEDLVPPAGTGRRKLPLASASLSLS